MLKILFHVNETDEDEDQPIEKSDDSFILLPRARFTKLLMANL